MNYPNNTPPLPPPLPEGTVGKEKKMRSNYSYNQKEAARVCFEKGEQPHTVAAYLNERWPSLNATAKQMSSLRSTLGLGPRQRASSAATKQMSLSPEDKSGKKCCKVTIEMPDGRLEQRTDKKTAGALMALLVQK